MKQGDLVYLVSASSPSMLEISRAELLYSPEGRELASLRIKEPLYASPKAKGFALQAGDFSKVHPDNLYKTLIEAKRFIISRLFWWYSG